MVEQGDHAGVKRAAQAIHLEANQAGMQPPGVVAVVFRSMSGIN
jgi:hypothetical protein